MPYHVLKNSSEVVLKASKTHASSCIPITTEHPTLQLKPKGVIHATATNLYKPLQASTSLYKPLRHLQATLAYLQGLSCLLGLFKTLYEAS